MMKKLNYSELSKISGGHNPWYYYGWGTASITAAMRKCPAAFGHVLIAYPNQK